jgi:hypothetical protein
MAIAGWAEVIAMCIRDTATRHLDTLQGILDEYDPDKFVPAVISPDALRPRE